MSGAAITLEVLSPLNCWVGWQTEDDEDRKPTKVPYGRNGRKARADDPSSWLTRAEAERCAARLPKPYGFGGIGLEFTDLGNGYMTGGIDLDRCRDANGTIESWAREIIERFATYAEVSPSGTGVKLFLVFPADTLPTLQEAMRAKFGRQWKRSGDDHPPAIELYIGHRYFAVTNEHLARTPRELRCVPTDTLLWLITQAGPAFAKRKPAKGSGLDNSRSAKAFRKAVALRRSGATYEEMVEALRTDPETAGWWREKGEANNQRELRRIWERAGDLAALGGVDLTEDGIASLFVLQYRDRLRFCHDTGAWFEWDGNIWRREDTELAFDWCRQTCREVAQFVLKDSLRAILGRARTAGAVEKFARCDRALAVKAETWDRDPFLLGTPGGTVDLHTGGLRVPMQGDFITKQTAIAPAETPQCPQWFDFLHDATKGDEKLIRFLRQWCGYCLTGDVREHALLFIFGPGGNGKSVFLNAVSRILGDYAVVAAMDTFTASHSDRHPADLAMLSGARLVCVSETEEGRAWAENRIKALTGGDPITARFMRQDFFTFRPAFKITVVGNHKPTLRNVDDANRRRFNLAPFIHKPTAPDKELEHKLEAEWPAILRWMIDGCLDWQMHGLIRPDVVTSATGEYFAEQDLLQQWIDECCDTSTKPPHCVDTHASLFASWRAFATARGEEAGTAKRFSQALQRAGFKSIRDDRRIRGRGFEGIKVHIYNGEG